MAEVRVLVVDDQEPFRRAAGAMIVATDGFVLAGVAADGEESLRAVVRDAVDLVLMDVNLPGMDGLEATRRIRALAEPPVVILVSTYELTELGPEVLSCGAQAYVPKAEFDSARLHQVWLEATS